MLFDFNQLIEHHGLSLDGVRLLRHDRRGLACWRRSPAHFDDFVSVQKPGTGPYHNASIAFQFIPGPALEAGDNSALFVRAHRILDEWAWIDASRMPCLAMPGSSYLPKHGVSTFDLEVLPEFDQYAERVLVNWGLSTRGWSQWAGRQPKEVVELRRTVGEIDFPGFAAFSATVEDVPVFPRAWVAALSSVGGVYLLVCPETGEQYVGSATGTGGFFARWSAYALNGHGGNQRLKARGESNYTITILEVASPDMAPSDVIRREAAWKIKLGSRAHGLNAN